MNAYFIVEGRRTEKKVYPKWLNFLIPELKRKNYAFEVKKNNYFLFNGNGFPALLHNHLKNSIEEVNALKVFDYLILILDVDETSVEIRIKEVNKFINENKLKLETTKLFIIPQDKCIETWFLGNKKIFKSNPQNPILTQYNNFYNVKENNPEEMGVFSKFNTHSQFHADYCIKFLRERNIRYSKNNPNGVIELDYLENLIKREKNTSHLKSFKRFIDFCDKLRKEITNTTANKI